MLGLLRSRIVSSRQALPSWNAAGCCCSASAGPSSSWQGRLLGNMESIRQFSASSPDLTKVKIKTHKGAAKRWTSLPSGQYKRGRPGKRHLNVSLSSVRLNRLGQTGYATPAHIKQLKKLLPGQ